MTIKINKSFKDALIYPLIFGLSLLLSLNTFAKDGAKIFKANCSSCHRADSKKLTGPGLEGVLDRVPSKQWIHDWVHDSKALIESGDAYANEVFEANNKIPMMPFGYLTDEDIDAIIDFIANPPVKKNAPKVATASADVAPVEEESNAIFWMLGLAVIFFVLINVLVGVKRSLKSIMNERHGLPPLESVGHFQLLIDWFKINTKVTTLLVIVVLLTGASKGWDALLGIGVYQGYKPEQPIKFSHKIHAGENKINCVYCHSSAEKGKTSGIPSINVCMNCHKGIQEGTQTGTTEIAKIYEAAGYNPETQQYDKPQKPVKWIKVHNLPDFVYYNHSQHVVVGKQKCQTCHGPIETMDVVEQYSPLTMRWCIDCHRKTNVAMKGNAYYDKIHEELVEKYKAEGKTTFTVEEIGGLECAKCHY